MSFQKSKKSLNTKLFGEQIPWDNAKTEKWHYLLVLVLPEWWEDGLCPFVLSHCSRCCSASSIGQDAIGLANPSRLAVKAKHLDCLEVALKVYGPWKDLRFLSGCAKSCEKRKLFIWKLLEEKNYLNFMQIGNLPSLNCFHKQVSMSRTIEERI